jgi:membrane protein required for colicin V production
VDLQTVAIAPIDIFFIAVVLIATIRCLIRGFVREIMSVAALVGGIAAAVLFSAQGAEFVVKYLQLTRLSRFIAFLGIFILVYLVIKICEGLIQRLLEKLHLEKLDRALGFFLGIIEGILLITVIIFVMQIQPFFPVEKVLQESFIAQIIMKYLPVGLELINTKSVTTSV